MQPQSEPPIVDRQFRRGLGLCSLGLAALLLAIVSAISVTALVPLVFGFVGLILAILGAIDLMTGP